MSAENATEYADIIASRIREMTEAGSPFGWTNVDTEEWIDYDPETEPTFHAGQEWREASALDYLQDVLDIEYRVSSTGEYKSAEILVAFGGPNAWIDTKTRELRVTWWSEPVTRNLPAAFIDGLDEALEELWISR